jgi:hypothetical protein
MGNRASDTRRSAGATALVVAGVLALLFSVGQLSFSCFMVTDPSCQSGAFAKAVPVVLVGIGLIVAGVWVAAGRNRGGA